MLAISEIRCPVREFVLEMEADIAVPVLYLGQRIEVCVESRICQVPTTLARTISAVLFKYHLTHSFFKVLGFTAREDVDP